MISHIRFFPMASGFPHTTILCTVKFKPDCHDMDPFTVTSTAAIEPGAILDTGKILH